MDKDGKQLLVWLVDYLLRERGESASGESLSAMDESGLWRRFRALVNMRFPEPVDEAFLERQDALLRAMIADAGIIDVSSLAPCANDGRISIWRGDITTLAADAIVNAANSQMLGCWVPGHHCIDNAIHTFAGVQLRIECDRIMREQGHDEPTGSAKVTQAFNLPSRWIIHTVGPIADGHPSDEHRRQLGQCYLSCLDAGAEFGCESIAFCCISTGVFGFPKERAAQIAVKTVKAYLNMHAGVEKVVFNVFADSDRRIYEAILNKKPLKQEKTE